MSALPPRADIRPWHGLLKGEGYYRQDLGAARQPITVASMALAPPTFRQAPSDHWQGYGIT